MQGRQGTMAAAIDSLSAELAFKANIDAAARDYVCEPNLGKPLEGAEDLCLGRSTCQSVGQRPSCMLTPLTIKTQSIGRSLA